MANIEYFDNKMKTERVAVQARAATGADIQPASRGPVVSIGQWRAEHESYLQQSQFEEYSANVWRLFNWQPSAGWVAFNYKALHESESYDPTLCK